MTRVDRDAAIAAARYLLGQGHRRLAYVSAMDAEGGRLTDIGQISNSAVRERVEGFFSVLTEAGLPNPLHYVRLGATDQHQTDGVIKRLLRTVLRRRRSGIGQPRRLAHFQIAAVARPVDPQGRVDDFVSRRRWTSVAVPRSPSSTSGLRDGRARRRAAHRRIERATLAVKRLRVGTSLVLRGSVAAISR